jgi:hypothetical protein
MASAGCDFAFEIVVAAALEQDINKYLGLVCKAQIDTPHVSPSPWRERAGSYDSVR